MPGSLLRQPRGRTGEFRLLAGDYTPIYTGQTEILCKATVLYNKHHKLLYLRNIHTAYLPLFRYILWWLGYPFATSTLRKFFPWRRFEKDLLHALQVDEDNNDRIIVEPFIRWSGYGRRQPRSILVRRGKRKWIRASQYLESWGRHRSARAALIPLFESEVSGFLENLFTPSFYVFMIILFSLFVTAAALPFLLGLVNAATPRPLPLWLEIVGIAGCLLVSFGFYILRENASWFYGTIEVGVAAGLFWHALAGLSVQAQINSQTNAEFSFKIMAAIYIFVRGCDNVSKSVTKIRKERTEDNQRIAREARDLVQVYSDWMSKRNPESSAEISFGFK